MGGSKGINRADAGTWQGQGTQVESRGAARHCAVHRHRHRHSAQAQAQAQCTGTGTGTRTGTVHRHRAQAQAQCTGTGTVHRHSAQAQAQCTGTVQRHSHSHSHSAQSQAQCTGTGAVQGTVVAQCHPGKTGREPSSICHSKAKEHMSGVCMCGRRQGGRVHVKVDHHHAAHTRALCQRPKAAEAKACHRQMPGCKVASGRRGDKAWLPDLSPQASSTPFHVGLCCARAPGSTHPPSLPLLPQPTKSRMHMHKAVGQSQ